MQRPLIAVDIDEVLAQHNTALAVWHNQHFGTKYTAESFFTDTWSKVWNIDSDTAEKRAEAFHASGAHSLLEPIEDARKALIGLQKTHDLIIITVRRQAVIDATHRWLDKHYPSIFKGVHFIHSWDTAQRMTKADLCVKLGASYLIDDSLKHCQQASNRNVQALLFGNYSWNRANYLPPSILRMDSWVEVTKYFSSFSHQE